MTRGSLRAAARRILRAGLAAVEPGRLVRAHLVREGDLVRVGGLRLGPKRRVFVVAVGKAAIPMARTALRVLGARVAEGIVIAPQRPPRMPRTRGFKSGHPVPDAAGIRASRAVIDLLARAHKDDVVLLLLSGGASALMPAPIDGITLGDKQQVTELLLKRGAAISEINAVRKQLSALKGGGFARLAAPARVVALVLSDVPGDDPRTIGSGPTVEDPGAATVARRTFRRFVRAGEVSDAVVAALKRKRPDGVAGRVRTLVIGSGGTFAQAAAGAARALGFRTRVAPMALEGEARRCGPRLVASFEAARSNRPACLIATGETVVRVTGTGRGGRNQELALASVGLLAKATRPTVLAAFATDGRDGHSSASGGLVDDRTARRARTRGLDIDDALARNDSERALETLGALIVTGATGTNVADVCLILG